MNPVKIVEPSGPMVRCPCCGGMVQMPCMSCYFENGSKYPHEVIRETENPHYKRGYSNPIPVSHNARDYPAAHVVGLERNGRVIRKFIHD